MCEFNSKEELYLRVRPALSAKSVELERLGYGNIKNVEIWNYLIEEKWKKGKDLMLSDIVNDILTADCEKISNYIKLSILKRTQNFDDKDIL